MSVLAPSPPLPSPSRCLSDDEVLGFVDGQLDAAGVAAAIAHLDRCDACRQVVAGATPTADDGALGSHGEVSEALSSGLDVAARVGRFVVLGQVGRGGMGEVYAAWDPDLGRKVALKIVRADMRHEQLQARLRREAQALARLSDPDVITIYEVGAVDDGVFIAMEFMDGGTLRQWLRGAKRTWREVLERFLRAGQGLAAAHDAGLVHRDFKPDNVLLSDDGRQRVTDFGLARVATDDPRDTAVDVTTRVGQPACGAVATPIALRVDSPLDVTLTSAGALVGTPAYMAPEQLRAIADARSDQFSFCASLYQALYGELPFASPDLGVYVAAVKAGKVRPPPRGAKVPSCVRSIVVRGLAADPDARWPSMRVLLRALRRTTLGRRTRIAAIAAVVLVAGGGYALATRSGAPPSCAGAAHQLDGVWDDARRRTVHDAFARSGDPFAPAMWTSTSAILDGWARDWTAMRGDACEDTEVRRVQPEHVLELRYTCLDHRREEARALVDVLATADASMIERAPGAASGLTSLAECADVPALTRIVAPRDRAQATDAAAIDKEIARLTAEYRSGKRGPSLDAMKALVERARKNGYVPTLSTATYQLGNMDNDAGKPEDALVALQESALASVSGRDDMDAEVAWAKLGSVAAGMTGHEVESATWLRYAEAAEASRGAKPDDVTAELLQHQFLAAMSRSDLALGERAIRKRLALEQALPNHDVQRRESAGNLAIVLLYEGKDDEGYKLLVPLLDEEERTFGATFPDAITLREDVGYLLTLLHRDAEALPLLERSLTARIAATGEHGFDAADDRTRVARALWGLGRLDEAEAQAREAVADVEKVIGKDNSALCEPVSVIGSVLLAEGRAAEAVPVLERANTLAMRDPGGALFLSSIQFELAKALVAAHGDHARAVTLATAARDAYRERATTWGGDNVAHAVEVERWLATNP